MIVRASVLAHLNRDAEAREAAEQALAIADASLTKRPRYIAAWDAKAAAFRLLGRDDETRAAEERIAALLG